MIHIRIISFSLFLLVIVNFNHDIINVLGKYIAIVIYMLYFILNHYAMKAIGKYCFNKT